MGVALIAWWLEDDVGWPINATIIGVVLLFNAVLGWAEQNKVRETVARLARRTAEPQDRNYIFCRA